ncbi:beta-aspartyl-peptidase [Lysobacter hankyongensis]|uniref:Isoaspartyl dipeptidase n=1 Tax=Lysobacter hankyongensis TaxID=1176535 RepID=A0ABP9BZC3_9GAMM
MALTLTAAHRAPPTLIRNAHLFAPEDRGPRQLLIGGGRILWIGDTTEAAPTIPGLDTIDLGGKRLIPGLIDGHAHVTGGGGEGGFATRVPPVPLSRFTAAGVTTVVGVLGTDDLARSPGELLASVHALREQGLAAFAWCGGYHLPPVTLTGSVRGDIVYLDPVIGVGELAISDHRSSQPTFDECLRIASDCHVAGLMTGKAGVLHLHLGDGPRGLELVRRALDETELPARTFHPTHVNRRKALFEEALTLARRGCTVDITAFPVDDGEDAWSAADAWERYRAAGAPAERITISSDAGGCLPTFDHDGRLCRMDVGRSQALIDTLRTLLARGHALDAVLPAFTRNVARALRLAGKGEIAVGADADLVALDADGGVTDVMAQGMWHVRDGDVLRHGPFEHPTRHAHA